MVERTVDPELTSRNRMSALPSPLKSAVAAIAKLLPTWTSVKADGAAWCEPLISERIVAPELAFRKRISAYPSPLKSPDVDTTFHSGPSCTSVKAEGAA